MALNWMSIYLEFYSFCSCDKWDLFEECAERVLAHIDSVVYRKEKIDEKLETDTFLNDTDS